MEISKQTRSTGESWSVAEAGMGLGLWSLTYPAAGLGSPVDFVAGLQNVYASANQNSGRATIAIDQSNLAAARIFSKISKEPRLRLISPHQGAYQRSRDLKRKMNIMLDHWHEYESLYPATQVWELEPSLPVSHEASSKPQSAKPKQ